MKTVLLFGAGKSATVLIDYLIEESASEKSGWNIIIADVNKELIVEKTKGHHATEAIAADIMNDDLRSKLINRADLVISMMPPSLHILIAKDCLQQKRHLLTASYADKEIMNLHEEVSENNILFLYEMGLDPGIDHMSAMQLLDAIREKGAKITSFKSHCGGLVAPESDDNPWHYKITWNPRNIILAGKAGATYKLNNNIVKENYEELFDPSRLVNYDSGGIDQLSYYPNRDSLPYIELYNLQEAATFIRTTLRYRDFMYGWKNLIDLKLTEETHKYDTENKTLHQFFREHLEKNGFGEWLQQKLSERFKETKTLLENLMKLMEAEEEAEKGGEEVPGEFMVVDETGDLKNIEIDEIKNFAASTMAHKMHEANLIMKQLFFIGLDDEETIINKGSCTAAEVLQFSLEKKLALRDDDKDMIVMLHEIEYALKGQTHYLHSTLTVKGNDNLHTAMAKTVGLPLGIAAKLILNGSIALRGVHVPVAKEIYLPVLNELKTHGISFIERSEILE
ncbi:MAG: saccharopine dehydrogenase C-terminal domain-containing protein [Ferruginibacter sp.]